ncbi:hypothetical protein [Erwinia sp. JUb26]|uniref:hypothetical protein n=1 Tax=Erwinia sp. JUb26 TaxID=2485126 RepID=UPI000F464FE2|nr:hypothetical protein [Erwinia sp. JUb26]ROR15471.1 hypothetical protein EC836_101978 [Erwinia sp. JUb26]
MTTEAPNAVEQVKDHRIFMFLKKIVGESYHGCVFYIFLSLVLYLCIGLDLRGFVNQKAVSIFFENIAPDSIMILFTAGGMLTIIRMMATGPTKDSLPKKGKFYRFLVFPVVNTGKVLAISGLGMMIGNFIVSLFFIDTENASLKAFYLLAVFTMYIFFFGVMEYFGKYGYTPIISECCTQFMLATLLVILPCLYVWAN